MGTEAPSPTTADEALTIPSPHALLWWKQGQLPDRGTLMVVVIGKNEVRELGARA